MLNSQSARFTKNKQTTNIYLVTDGSKVLETTSRENIPRLDCIDVYTGAQNSSASYTSKGYIEVCKVHKPKSHQVFTGVQVSPTDSMGKATDNK